MFHYQAYLSKLMLKFFPTHFFEIFPGSKYLNEINFILASCLEEKGKLDEAYNKFKLLRNKYIYPVLLKMKMESLEKRIKKK